MRQLPSFIDGYVEYARDNYCPETYHLWTGISIVAAALERKTWFQRDKSKLFPNLYVLLVGNPAAGKTSAITRCLPIIEGLQTFKRNFKFSTGEVSPAGLCRDMSTNYSKFYHDGKEEIYSPMFYYSDEASNGGLQQLGGNFSSMVTDLYDTKNKYKKTLSEKTFDIPKPCFNMLAGSTFSFLSTLVDEKSVMNGLASRFVYVVSKEPMKKDEEENKKECVLDSNLEKKIISDLVQIYDLVGEFKFDEIAKEIYQVWKDDYVDEFNSVNSERRQSIISRKPTLLHKVLMVLSASERDDLLITSDHMTKAIYLVDRVTKANNSIISSAIIGNKTSQDATSQFILTAIGEKGDSITISALKNKYVGFGGDIMKYNSTIQMMWGAGMIQMSGDNIQLLVDPDTNF